MIMWTKYPAALILSLFIQTASAQTTKFFVTSGPLGVNTVSVIIEVNGVQVPDCGPTIGTCILDDKMWYDITALIDAGAPFTIAARACNAYWRCTELSTIVPFDSSLGPVPSVLSIVPEP